MGDFFRDFRAEAEAEILKKQKAVLDRYRAEADAINAKQAIDAALEGIPSCAAASVALDGSTGRVVLCLADGTRVWFLPETAKALAELLYRKAEEAGA